eukprot:342034-Chlamydomonas_euryale.AAC.2
MQGACWREEGVWRAREAVARLASWATVWRCGLLKGSVLDFSASKDTARVLGMQVRRVGQPSHCAPGGSPERRTDAMSCEPLLYHPRLMHPRA